MTDEQLEKAAGLIATLRAEIANLREENSELLGRCECYRVEVYTLRERLKRAGVKEIE